MTIKNLSNKLIGIGGSFILPGNEASGFEASVLQSNAVQSYIRLGLISVTAEAEGKDEATATPEEPASGDAEPKKRPGRRKAAE